MLISSAPFVLPISTANHATESVAAEVLHKPIIVEPKSPAEAPNTRSGTDSSENNRVVQDNKASENRAADGNRQENSDSVEDQSNQQSRQNSDSNQRQEQQQQIQINKLAQTDRQVKAHEAAHASVGGQYAGAPTFGYKTGPDGKRYAVSGEVSIDTSRVPNDPFATIRKMEQVRQAALAPVDPSSQDMKVAALASQIISQARQEINQQRFDDDHREGSQRLSSNENLKSEDGSSENKPVNPVAARRYSLQLNSKLAYSGALNLEEQGSRFSHRA